MRDTSLTICKAFTALFITLLLSGAPTAVCNLIVFIGAPMLFLCVGQEFFYQSQEEDAPSLVGETFVVRGIRTLYWPFLLWSVVLLVLHNLLFVCKFVGGDGAQLYSWHEAFQRLWGIVFNMSLYDEQVGANLWLLRSLFLSSIAFFVAYKLLRRFRPADSENRTALTIAVSTVLLIAWMIGAKLSIPGIFEGGYRELLGVLFIATGFLLAANEKYVRASWTTLVVCLAVLILGSIVVPSQMTPEADFAHFFGLLLPAIAGFLVVRQLAQFVAEKTTFVRDAMTFLGDNALCVIVFSLLSFKLVSMIKVAYYGLPWEAVGGCPVVCCNQGDAFWLLYLVSGIALPLLGVKLYRHLTARIDFSAKNVARWTWIGLVYVVRLLVRIVKRIAKAVWNGIMEIYNAFCDIIKASNPKDE